MEHLSALLVGTGLNSFVASSEWVWPICEILHYTGMSLLMGTVVLLDVRVLGGLKGLPIAKLHRLVPWGVFGFALNLITGFIFVAGTPETPMYYLNNLSFQLKMLCLLIAGINVGIYYLTGVARRADAAGPMHEAPVSARIIAAVSILMWICVIFFGRMLMYNDTLLYALGL